MSFTSTMRILFFSLFQFGDDTADVTWNQRLACLWSKMGTFQEIVVLLKSAATPWLLITSVSFIDTYFMTFTSRGIKVIWTLSFRLAIVSLQISMGKAALLHSTTLSWKVFIFLNRPNSGFIWMYCIEFCKCNAVQFS